MEADVDAVSNAISCQSALSLRTAVRVPVTQVLWRLLTSMMRISYESRKTFTTCLVASSDTVGVETTSNSFTDSRAIFQSVLLSFAGFVLRTDRIIDAGRKIRLTTDSLIVGVSLKVDSTFAGWLMSDSSTD